MLVTDVTDVTTQMVPHQRNEQQETESRITTWVQSSQPRINLLVEHRDGVVETLNEGLNIIREQLQKDHLRQLQITQQQELITELQEQNTQLERKITQFERQITQQQQIVTTETRTQTITDLIVKLCWLACVQFMAKDGYRMIESALWSDSVTFPRALSISIIITIMFFMMLYLLPNMTQKSQAQGTTSAPIAPNGFNFFYGLVKAEGTSANLFWVFLFFLLLYVIIATHGIVDETLVTTYKDTFGEIGKSFKNILTSTTYWVIFGSGNENGSTPIMNKDTYNDLRGGTTGLD